MIFVDNYLELVKARAYNEDGSQDEGQQSAVHTLHYCLNTILKLFAPFVPAHHRGAIQHLVCFGI